MQDRPVSAAISETRAGSTVVRFARGFPRKVVLGITRTYKDFLRITRWPGLAVELLSSSASSP